MAIVGGHGAVHVSSRPIRPLHRQVGTLKLPLDFHPFVVPMGASVQLEKENSAPSASFPARSAINASKTCSSGRTIVGSTSEDFRTRKGFVGAAQDFFNKPRTKAGEGGQHGP